MRSVIAISLLFVSFGLHARSRSQIDVLHQQAYELFSTNPDSACALGKKALKTAEKMGYEWGIANSHYIQGYAYRLKNELSKALLFYLKASEILKSHNDERSVKTRLELLMKCGVILQAHFRYDEAVMFFDEGILLAKENDHPAYVLKLLYNKASALQDKGDLNVAADILNKAIKKATELNDHSRVIKCRNLLGIILDNKKAYKQARKVYLDILQSPFSDREAKAKAFHNIGVSFTKEHEWDSAEYYFLQALTLKEELAGGDYLAFTTLRDLTELYLHKREPEAARRYGLLATGLYPDFEPLPEHYQVFELLNKVYHRLNKPDSSQLYASRYFAENARFVSHQEEVRQLKEQDKIELVLAGFYQDIKTKETVSVYQWIIGILVSLFLCWQLILHFRKVFIYKTLERELRNIEKRSWV